MNFYCLVIGKSIFEERIFIFEGIFGLEVYLNNVGVEVRVVGGNWGSGGGSW